MTQPPRIRRFDRIGNTADIPYRRTIADYKRERWITNRFFRLMGGGAFSWQHPEWSLHVQTVRGHNYFDTKDTGARVTTLEEVAKENIRTALRLEKLAKREEAAGHCETAADYYYRTVPFYHMAAWGILDSDHPELIWLTGKVDRNFAKVMQYSKFPMEKVEIPFEGRSIPAILSLTPGRQKAPTILFVPGMDTNKENGLNHIQNPFVLRGMNCLAIDGPGQGESLVRKIWVSDETYVRAGKAVLDYLVRRPEVDADRIGIHGLSMGTYWGPLIAAHDSRVRALSTHASCHGDKDQIFNETSPNYRLRYQWMAGNVSDEEFDRMAAAMTLEGKESRIKCPHIIFHGEYDHLTAMEEMYGYFDRLGSEVKELRIYENQFHGVHRGADEVESMSADWLKDRLTGVPPTHKRRIVLVDWNKEERPVDENKLACGFSFLHPDPE
jgi:dienelactone hydrolase